MDVCSTWLTFFLWATKFGGPLSFAERQITVHLLYVDESGSVTDASQRYFVLAGVSVFERTTHWIELALDKIARKADPITPDDRELHGSPMR